MTDEPTLNYSYFRTHVRDAIGPSERLDELTRGYSDADLIFAIKDTVRRAEWLQGELNGARSALGGVIRQQRETNATLVQKIERLQRYAWHKKECLIDANVYPMVPCSCGFNEVLEALRRSRT